MRLTCPNCDAQYEVPDSAIPAGGRDVQCSNCGHFWYQMPLGDADADAAEDALVEDDLTTETAEQSIARALATPSDAEPVGDAVAPEPDDMPVAQPAEEAPALDDEEPEDAPRPADAATARPKSLDESLVALLKEEAEREVQARKLEASRASPMPETQPDLGLTEPDESADRARRLAALQGEEPEPAPARPAARRDLLPDVEEINSTLQTSEVEARQTEAELADLSDRNRPKRGFRSGFSLVMLLLVVGIAAYVAAPQLKAQFPAAAPTVDAYVGAVNDAREWLDRMMNLASSAIQEPATE